MPNENVSVETKALYGLMLDHMGLSVRLFKELDKPSGIGLIVRPKKGQ